jgi:ATP-dependent Lon protease
LAEKDELTIPEELPLIPIRDIVVFPFMILPLFVARARSIKAIDEALAKDRMVFLASQMEAEKEEPEPEDVYTTGTIALIMRMLKVPDGRIKILVQGLSKGRIEKFLQEEPYMKVKVTKIEDAPAGELNTEVEALMRVVKERLQHAVSLGKVIMPDIMLIAENLEDPGRLADLVASNLGMKLEDAQALLEIQESTERLKKVNEIIGEELKVLEMQQSIITKAQEGIDKTQREYYLREQLKAIQKELGELDEKSEEMEDYKERIEKAKMPEVVEKAANKQLSRLERMHPDAAESSVIRTYLDWLVEIPWSAGTKDNLNIKTASKVLDEDHYDLEKVKTRILEYLSVRKLKKKLKGPILCFVGPPGVGKTSLGKSIARALGRKFVRISLGGVRDEAEIRGHRRTYVGALPGKIISGVHEVGSNNPVFMMDEVDKIGADFRGDPAAALLEVLDPEQNHSFTDHYLGVPFDLSKVMFITTANLLDPVPSALKDRMEVINLPGYTEEEKLHIAKRYLIPRQREEHGLKESNISISDRAILRIVSDYTREAGLRNLEREIATICRKVARNLAEGEDRLFEVNTRVLEKYLGVRKYYRESEVEESEVGVATGLAWTQTGGDILHIEATIMKGKGRLSLTGHLGDIMKESAQAAVSYARSKAGELGIDEDFFYKKDIHIHVPAGAIPKDGPSAGITITTALISALTGRPVSREVAMTGEVTLRGRALPIGGLKEKVLAARRADIKTIIVPEKNRKDISEIPVTVTRNMNFIFVEEMNKVLESALLGPPLKKRRKKTASRMKVSPGKRSPRIKGGK